MIGTQIQALFEQAQRMARFDRPILIRGERGTGKELMARYIHSQSSRQSKPYLTVNCGALDAQLANSTLFGHEKGAFTGASQQRLGKFELADGGTLFLDEIGNMSPEVQDKIIRVLEYQSFERVGGSQALHTQARLISATNANLEELTQSGRFKADLYDRISHGTITLPPLRQRREDIPELIQYFITQMHQEIPNLEVRQMSPEVLKILKEYHWPGNIRELKNTIERLYMYSLDQVIDIDDLPPNLSGMKITGDSFEAKVENFQRKLILDALERNQHQQKAAAQSLKMTYDQFRHYYRKFIPKS